MVGRRRRASRRTIGLILLTMMGVAWSLGACGQSSGAASNVYAEELKGPCIGLFGSPTDSTGLDSSRCRPSCSCGEQAWSPPSYDQVWLEGIRSWQLTNPPSLLQQDPYGKAPTKAPAGAVCGMLPDGGKARTYAIATYPSVAAAEKAGAKVTHFGACGQCSSLQNLAVYVSKPDLTDPVRSCAMKGLSGDDKAAMACLEAIGFDRPCAQIWYFNTVNTRKSCLDVCLANMNKPHHGEDG